jgi:type VI secretion system lysozyme-like protein
MSTRTSKQHRLQTNASSGVGIQRGLLYRLSSGVSQSVNELRVVTPTEQLAQDLERLLNTRNVGVLDERKGKRFPHAAHSVLNFGVGELIGLSPLNIRDRTVMSQRIADAISAFEPRLRKVRVSITALDQHPRQIQFRIEAVLKTHPLQPEVQFSALMDLGSQHICLHPST